MKKSIRTQLNKLAVGSLICIRWGDPSASPVEDGSPEDLVKNHKGYNYFSWGVYMGVNKQHKTIILASDKVVDAVHHGVTGLVVPSRDHVALANALIKMLKDDKLRNQIGKNAYEYVTSEYSWDSVSQKTMDVYNWTLNNNKN